MTLRYGICAAALLAGFIVAGGDTAAVAKDTVAGGETAPVAKDTKASCPAFKAGIDADNDGTLDLNEAKAAASKLFDKRHGKDGTVTAKELQGRLSKKELAAGDPDKDGTLTKDEFLAIVESRFKAANADSNASIDCKEAKTKAGHELLRLLK